MKLRPIGERIIVKPIAPEEVTKGGVVLAPSAQEEQQRGIVVGIGPGRLLDSGYRDPIDVPMHATVLYGKYAGAGIKIDGDDYVMLRIDDVFGVEEEGEFELPGEPQT